MQLYKPRGFGEYFQDTFAFLRRHGKHFYQQFFIINGIFLLILIVIGYFFSQFYKDMLFSGFVGNNGGNAYEEYINQNAVLFLILLSVFTIVGLISAIISYAYVPIYLKLYAQKNNINFSATDIINTYKANIGKIFLFLICGIVVAIPTLIISGLLIFLLSITIIGILLFPFVIGGVSLFYQGTLMEYLHGKNRVWDSFGYTWKLMSSKFWASIGSVGLFYLMGYVALQVVSLIPYFLGIINLMTDMENGINPDPQDVGKTFLIIMLIIFFLTFILGTFLILIIQLNQGIVFYSLKEDNENIHTKSDIDLIGFRE